jgi:adenylylsulfate kinase-like enzyme
MNLNLQPNNILLLIGPSHAGKSTFSEQLKNKLEKLNKKVKIISSDEIRKDLLQLDTQDETKTTKGQTVNHIVFPLLEKKQIQFVVFIGEEELKQQSIQIKNSKTRDAKNFPINDINSIVNFIR